MSERFRYSKVGEEHEEGHGTTSHKASSDEQISNREDHASWHSRGNCWRALAIITGCCFLFNMFWTLALALTWESLCWNRPGDGPRLIHCEQGIPSKLVFELTVFCPAPAREAVSYKLVDTNSTVFTKNDFMGRPRPEQTRMWYDSYTKCEFPINRSQ